MSSPLDKNSSAEDVVSFLKENGFSDLVDEFVGKCSEFCLLFSYILYLLPVVCHVQLQPEHINV